jgi:hypothetical protein
VVVEVGVNEWNGRREIQLRLVDIAHAGAVEVERKAEAAQRVKEPAH